MKMKTQLLTLLLLIVLAGYTQAQELVVKSFVLSERETINDDDWMHDTFGGYGALVRVRVSDKIESVKGNVLGEPLSRNGEQWVFLTSGTKIFTLNFREHYPLTIETSKSDIFRLEGKCIYVLTLVEEQQGIPVKPIQTAPSARLKIHYTYPLTGPLKLNGSEALNQATSSGMSIGLDAGLLLTNANSSFRLYGFAGLGLSMYNMKLGHSIVDYNYETNQDIDGDKYQRHYRNLNLQQKASLTQLTIPVYLNTEYAFGDMSVYASLGMMVNMNISKKLEDNGSTVEGAYGVYGSGMDERNSIAWAKNVGQIYALGQNANGFSDDMKALDNSVYNGIDGVAATSFDLLAGVGFRFTIPSSPITVDLSLNYVSSLGNIISPSDDKETKKYIYNKIGSDLISTEYTNSLTNQLESVKRLSMMLSAGLIYDF